MVKCAIKGYYEMIKNFTNPHVITVQIYLQPTSVYIKIKKIIIVTGLKVEMGCNILVFKIPVSHFHQGAHFMKNKHT